MKNKIITTILSLLVLTMLISCGGDVSIIKKGSMNFDRSVTIGNVFKSYQAFNKTEWKDFKDPQGRRIVEVNSEIDFTNLTSKDWNSIVEKSSIPEILFYAYPHIKLKSENNPITKEFPKLKEYNHQQLSGFYQFCKEIIAVVNNDPEYQNFLGDMTLSEYYSGWFDSDGNIYEGSFSDNKLYHPILMAIKNNNQNEALKCAKDGIKTIERFVLDPDSSEAVIKFQFSINKDKSFQLIYGGIFYKIKLKGFDGYIEHLENGYPADMLQDIYAGNKIL